MNDTENGPTRFWIHAFEILCYVLTAILLYDLVHRKEIAGMKLFLSGAIAGFVLELQAVRITDINHYNPGFWLNIGREPSCSQYSAA